MTDWLDLAACRSLQVLSFFVRLVSLKNALFFGRFLGAVGFWLSNRRHVAYADMKAALGPALSESERWKTVREHYANMGQVLMEILYFPELNKARLEKMVRVDYLDADRSAFEGDGGRIFLAAHYGNWEMMAAVPPRFSGKSMAVLARDQKFPLMNQFLNSLRESLGNEVITRGIEIRDLLRSLRRKEWVALLGDQDSGRQGGIILPFFGRKTTVPTGPFEIAARTAARIYPTLIVRRQFNHHDMYMGRAIECRRDSPEDIEAGARYYLSVLEDFIRRYPSQWLWGTKRWKYTWTKRILILSDGKPGHVKQSESVAEQIRGIKTQYGREGMEYPTEKIEVQFKSGMHRRLFPWFAFFFIPWAQGHLRFLKFFFTPETAKAVEEASADFIISAGSSLVPLNFCLARDSRAKSIVLMKPSFPFNLFRIDLTLVPAHDRGNIPAEAFRTLLAPSSLDPESLESDAAKLSPGLRDISKIRTSVFLGGDTRQFKMKLADIQKLFESLEQNPEGGDYLATTSRRTSPEIAAYLKNTVRHQARCQGVIIAQEDSRKEVVGGMMALAEVLIVTEDSISMISEALRAGKKVVVLCFESKGLPTKHRRFREILAREAAIVTATPANLTETLSALRDHRPATVAQTETEALKKRLQAIL
jgi:KDO2-lipid IV(A) lauroyltransferase